ncbi:MAG: CoA transferase [Actinomycetota bacterium]|jgi:crotonobetainyl-CoA:carnitine CoA-transferase CaiB-like acyl-CoA transferase|nr:CoA transferase [Actinomycetota bacterium]|tara:strand:- start:263 stop:1441 length:1179 start_codon:yes stop_codon:yes gene_type:complete
MSSLEERRARGALGHLRIADFSRVLAGPLATMVLGDLGADVVKVEQPGVGDDTRTWGPPWWDDGDGPTSTYFLTLNRNKRSIALDLRRPDDLAVARRIALGADVVVDNFRPGTMGRFDLDRESLAAEKPSIITCSITGFGSSGPGGDLAGYDFLIQAMSGLMHVTGEVDGEPSKVGSAVVDKLTGLYAAIGILAALEERRETGLGQHVEVSLMQSALAGLLNVGSAHVAADVDPGRHGNRHPSIAPYEPYRAADGMVAVAAASPVLWERFADVLGRPEWCDDPRFADNEGRVANVEALATEVEAVLVDGSVEEWVGRLQAAGIPAGPINDVRSAFATAEALGLDPVDVLGEGDGAFRSVRSPMGLSATPPSVRRPPPRNDQHGDEIRDGLGD